MPSSSMSTESLGRGETGRGATGGTTTPMRCLGTASGSASGAMPGSVFRRDWRGPLMGGPSSASATDAAAKVRGSENRFAPGVDGSVSWSWLVIGRLVDCGGSGLGVLRMRLRLTQQITAELAHVPMKGEKAHRHLDASR